MVSSGEESPCNAGDTGSIPGPRGFHTHAAGKQPVCHFWSRAPWSLRSAAREAIATRSRAPQREGSPHSLQLGQDLTRWRRRRAVKKRFLLKLKIIWKQDTFKIYVPIYNIHTYISIYTHIYVSATHTHNIYTHPALAWTFSLLLHFQCTEVFDHCAVRSIQLFFPLSFSLAQRGPSLHPLSVIFYIDS